MGYSPSTFYGKCNMVPSLASFYIPPMLTCSLQPPPPQILLRRPSIVNQKAPMGAYSRMGAYLSEIILGVGAYTRRGLNGRRSLIESLRCVRRDFRVGIELHAMMGGRQCCSAKFLTGGSSKQNFRDHT